MKAHPHTTANALPLVVFALGVAGVTVGLWLSRSLGLIEACSVYFEGCLSISASGRQAPAVYFFRAALLPMTVSRRR